MESKSYFKDSVHVGKVLKCCPVEVNHLGVLPCLLRLGALSHELLATLLELWVAWHSWESKKLNKISNSNY